MYGLAHRALHLLQEQDAQLEDDVGNSRRNRQARRSVRTRKPTSWTWVMAQLLDLLRQYPGGLAEPALMTEILSRRIRKQGKADCAADARAWDAGLQAPAPSTRGNLPLAAPPSASTSGHTTNSAGGGGSTNADSQNGCGNGGGGGGGGWETVVAGQPLQLDEDYYRRLAAGELQDWEVEDPPTGCRMDGPLLAGGRYLVTRRTNELVQLLTGLLEDACAGSRALSRALLSAVSGIALLARTLPPVAASASSASASSTSADQLLSSVPQLGLLAVNDLQHLAAMLLLLSQAYGAALEAATGEAVTPGLLREAMQLRAAARARMRDLLRSQYDILDEMLAGLDSLRTVGGSDSKAGLRHRRSLQQLLHSLGRLGRTASEVMSPEDGVALAAAVINHVAGQLAAAVLAKSDLSRDECTELAQLLGPLAEGAVDTWLAAARGAGQELSGIPMDVVAGAISARASQLRKLRCLLQVLGSDTLSRIEQLWDSGELAMLAAQELEHLLLAISEDSPGRRVLLQKLQ